MLGIQIRLSMVFYPQTDMQTKCINQELEQYLQFFVNHKQKNWPEQLVSVGFIVNSKVYLATKVSPFMENYGQKLRMGAEIRRKRKIKRATKFAVRMKQIYKKARAVLKQAQGEMKKQTDRKRRKVEPWKKRDRIMLDTKDLIFKE